MSIANDLFKDIAATLEAKRSDTDFDVELALHYLQYMPTKPARLGFGVINEDNFVDCLRQAAAYGEQIRLDNERSWLEAVRRKHPKRLLTNSSNEVCR